MTVPHPLIPHKYAIEWERHTRRWRGKVMTGLYAHWCSDWDDLPIDETTPEWPCACSDDLIRAVEARFADGRLERREPEPPWVEPANLDAHIAVGPEAVDEAIDADVILSGEEYRDMLNEMHKLSATLREATKLMTSYAREAGEATGRLQMSEAAGIVDGWRERAEAAEARVVALEAEPHFTPEDNTIGAAERAVGQWVYRRIETLMNAKITTSIGNELVYLAAIASDVEEYGATGDHPPGLCDETEPKGDSHGGRG